MILDSRGRPTIEAGVALDTGDIGVAAVPSGASTGSHEAVELRDGDQARYMGLSVDRALANILGPIEKAVRGRDVRDQAGLDQVMIDLDGTLNKSSLGANAMLAVSLAAMRAHSALARQPLWRTIQQTFDFTPPVADRLPRPMMNVINGGRHADTSVKIQEFMIIPQGKTVAERIAMGATIYAKLGALLRERSLATTVGDEGGYAPRFAHDVQALQALADGVRAAGFTVGTDVELGLDLAMSEWYDEAAKRYRVGEKESGLSAAGVIGWIQEMIAAVPVASLEDPLAEDDWAEWATATEKLGTNRMIVGDDLFVTHADRLQRGIDEYVANSILIKPNQVGTLSETIKTIQLAQTAGYTVIISHRSGETNDSFISDLAVAVGASFIKAGAPARGERVAKYNRLLAIERELKS